MGSSLIILQTNKNTNLTSNVRFFFNLKPAKMEIAIIAHDEKKSRYGSVFEQQLEYFAARKN